MFPFFKLSYTIFFVFPTETEALSVATSRYPYEVPFVLFCACKVSTLSNIWQRKLAFSSHFFIKNWLTSMLLTRIKRPNWFTSTLQVDVYQFTKPPWLWKGVSTHKQSDRTCKSKTNLSVFAYISIVIRQYEVSCIPTTWSITLKRSLLFP